MVYTLTLQDLVKPESGLIALLLVVTFHFSIYLLFNHDNVQNFFAGVMLLFSTLSLLLAVSHPHPFYAPVSDHESTDWAQSGSLQSIMTWDEYSISIQGERLLFLSSKFHPFQLPSPGVWLDVLQKIQALG